ncbi:putative inhibitor of apoptosis [Pecten maximus]|uniref:putative inhibitor of apoptosis n=1 Tax=Pecten maximus TaxID=6579 RepID=UPI00145877FC|nr:putative inhibitor of apoptosis [Pecten maximus]
MKKSQPCAGQGGSSEAFSTPPVEADIQMAACKDSFMYWSGDISLDVDAMAEARWCYIGNGRVTTLCCKAVCDWKATDDPWKQHAIYSPGCSFLIQQMGQAYVDSVQAGFPTDELPLEQPDAQMGPLDDQVSEQPDAQMSPQEELEIQRLFEENELLKRQTYCLVCEEEPRQITYLPCGHLVCCGICGLAQTECPICKETITGRITTFWS